MRASGCGGPVQRQRERSCPLLLAVGDGAQQGVLGLPAVQSRMLHDYREIGTDDAREVLPLRDGFRVVQLVEAQVYRALGGNGHPVGAGRLAVAEVDRYLDVRIAVTRVEEAGGLVAGHLGLRPVAVGGDVPLGYRPDLLAKCSVHVRDRKSTRLNSSHVAISYAVF